MSKPSKYLIIGPKGSGKSVYSIYLREQEQIDRVYDEIISTDVIESAFKESEQEKSSVIACTTINRDKIPNALLEQFEVIELQRPASKNNLGSDFDRWFESRVYKSKTDLEKEALQLRQKELEDRAEYRKNQLAALEKFKNEVASFEGIERTIQLIDDYIETAKNNPSLAEHNGYVLFTISLTFASEIMCLTAKSTNATLNALQKRLEAINEK